MDIDKQLAELKNEVGPSSSERIAMSIEEAKLKIMEVMKSLSFAEKMEALWQARKKVAEEKINKEVEENADGSE